jgi:hypothetical protein
MLQQDKKTSKTRKGKVGHDGKNFQRVAFYKNVL